MKLNHIFITATLIAAGALGAVALGEDDRTPQALSNLNPETQRPRPEAQAEAQEGIGMEYFETKLDPAIEAIQTEYAAKLEAVKEELATIQTSDEETAIQARIEALKFEMQLAVAYVQLDKARERKDNRRETEILGYIDHMTRLSAEAAAEGSAR